MLYTFVYAQGGEPVIVYPENETRPVANYAAADPEDITPIVWSVSGIDAKYFNIVDGVLSFKSPPDYENPPPPVDPGATPLERRESRNVYEVTVEASDGGGANTSETEIFVKVINVDDPGEVTLSSVQPEGGLMLIATLTDPDGLHELNPPGVIAATSWQWARSEDGMTGWTDIQGATAKEYKPVVADVDHYLRATARYWDSESFENPRDNYDDNFKTASAVSAEKVLKDRIANAPPDFGDRTAAQETADDTNIATLADPTRYLDRRFPEWTEIDRGQRRVGENAVAGQPVGNPVLATDPEKDTLTYSLRGVGTSTDPDFESYKKFDIDPVTGQIKVAAGARLNFEDTANTDNEYQVTVLATDPFFTPGTTVAPPPNATDGTEPEGAYDTIVITIKIVDVDENPTIPDIVTVPVDTMQGPNTMDHKEGFADIDADGDADENNDGELDIDFAAPTYIMSDPEDVAAVKKWFLAGPDASKFVIGNTDDDRGEIKFKAAPNFESPGDANTDNVYDITVIAADNAANIAEKRVTVKVTNVQETGNILLSSLQPQNGTPLGATLSDPDGGVSGVVWQWYRTRETFAPEATAPATRTDANTVADTGVWVRINNSEAAAATYTPKENRVDDAETELQKYLSVRATYTDNFGASVTIDTDSANPVQAADPDNMPPVFPETPAERSVLESEPAGTIVGAPVTAIDGDVDSEHVLTYWLSGPDAALFSIVQGNVADADLDTLGDQPESGGQIKTRTRLNHEAKDTYNVTVTVRDPSYDPTDSSTDRDTSDTINVMIKVLDKDEKPSLSGAARIVHPENDATSVGTYTAADPEEIAIVWSVSGTDAKYFNIVDGVLSFNSPPDYENPPAAVGTESREARNVYEVTVAASDGGGAGTTSTMDVLVKVTNVDDPGVIALSATQPIGDKPVLQRATLTDPDGLPPEGIIAATNWRWAKSMNGTTGWTDIEGATSRDYKPKLADVDHYLRATAKYWDSESFENPEPVYDDNFKMASMVTVEPVSKERITNNPPDFGDTAHPSITFDPVRTGFAAGFPETAEREPGERSVGENAVGGQPVGNRVVAKDPDGDTLTYSLRGAEDDADESYKMFDIDPVTGQISLAAGTRLNFEDTENTDNEFEVTVVATDPFFGQTISPDTDLPTGAAQGADDYDTIVVTIKIVDVDENPSIPVEATGPNTMDHPENTDAIDLDADTADTQAPTYTMSDPEDDATVKQWFLSGPDAGKFDIGNTVADDIGKIKFKAAPNFESPGDMGEDNVYNITVIGTDNAANTARKHVTVKVTNVQEDGSITLSSLQPQDGTPIRATLSDPDGGVTGVVWQWYRSTSAALTEPPEVGPPTNADDWAVINTAEARRDTYTPDAHRTDAAKSELDKYLWVRATYTDNAPATGRNPADAVSANTVQNADPDNQAPAFADEAVERSVEENQPVGTPVGAPVAATDADTDDENVLTYWLSGPDARYFGVDQNTGQINTKAKLDHEARETYTVTLTVRDPSYDPTDRSKDAGTSDTITVTIMVTDVDEMPVYLDSPVVVLGMRSRDFPENGSGTVADYNAGGPEASGAAWTLSGADAGDFSIDAAGMLIFSAVPNYESPADADLNNVYSVTVVATAASGATAELPVTITVTNVDEAGTVTLSPARPGVGTAVTATLEDDPDGGVTRERWQWAKSMDMTAWENIAGANTSSYTPVEADGGYYLRASVTYTDAQGPNKPAMEVSGSMVAAEPVEGDPLLAEYDPDGDDVIEMADMRRAVANFFGSSPTLTRADMRRLVTIYFSE